MLTLGGISSFLFLKKNELYTGVSLYLEFNLYPSYHNYKLYIKLWIEFSSFLSVMNLCLTYNEVYFKYLEFIFSYHVTL